MVSPRSAAKLVANNAGLHAVADRLADLHPNWEPEAADLHQLATQLTELLDTLRDGFADADRLAVVADGAHALHQRLRDKSQVPLGTAARPLYDASHRLRAIRQALS